MALSWNEIKTRASAFSKEWEHETSEDAEAKSFWDGFFNVFGISRRRVATFEQQVKKIDDKTGFIDLLWKGIILIEHKSRGKDLNRAYQQAKDYFPGLKDKELPRYILVSDFERFRLHDLEDNTYHEFTLTDFVNQVHLFGFIAGYQKRTYKEQDPVNIEAAELMGRLHDKLKEIGYTGHQLELYLVRLLFCLFADDTSIFERDIFHEYIELKTNEDGSDLALHISQIFSILNTPKEKRFKNIDDSLNAFPYVNGKLFEEPLGFASFDSSMRKVLIDCCLLDWGKISPAIFGSLFQSVMDATARRNLGAHYTSEKNILKLIKPLFLDGLYKEYETAKESKVKLQKFHEKISKLRFLDPACGCGNFLIIAYRELRLLEIEIIKTLLFRYEKLRPEVAAESGFDVSFLIKCDVDKFYGIEYEEFPAQIAQVALWLMDHQMNQLVTNSFGEYYVRLPLRKSATIVHGNSLRIDWQSLLNKESTVSIHTDVANIILQEPAVQYRAVNVFTKEVNYLKQEDLAAPADISYDYILGNPPFRGHHLQSLSQKDDLHHVLFDIQAAGVMDYVSAWYYKASEYLAAHNSSQTIKVGFVSTNSISQGEQVGILWSVLFNKFKIKIHFAHRTFKWNNEAKGIAAVYCVIIGFSNFNDTDKKIFEYETVISEPHEMQVANINQYLVDAKEIFITNRSKPLCKVPEMMYGSKPTDDGNFLLTDIEKNELLKKEPGAYKYIKPFISAREFLNAENRWCIWLLDADPSEIRVLPEILRRVEAVKRFRESSVASATRGYKFHTLFRQITQPQTDYILVPRHSSENRTYIPFGFFGKDNIVADSCNSIPSATLFHFGIMTSLMHMAWVKNTCGRIKSDFRYSKDIVYNNFPWPENPSDKQKEIVEKAAQVVLDARASFPNSSLADLYDPNTMPPILVKAHQALDKAVDLCYRPQAFINETKRIEYLFELYDKYTAGLFATIKHRKDRKPQQPTDFQ